MSCFAFPEHSALCIVLQCDSKPSQMRHWKRATFFDDKPCLATLDAKQRHLAALPLFPRNVSGSLSLPCYLLARPEEQGAKTLLTALLAVLPHGACVALFPWRARCGLRDPGPNDKLGTQLLSSHALHHVYHA